MKNKIPENSIFRKKGFFAALYSCVGVVLVLAAIISYNNIRNITNPPSGGLNLTEGLLDAPDEAADVNTDLTVPYPRQNSDPPEQGQGNFAPDIGRSVNNDIADILSRLNSPATPPPTASAEPDEFSPEADANIAPQTELTDNEPVESVEAADAGSQVSVNVDAGPLFENFSDDQKMNWPVLGDIVMDYSVNHAIYDKTLDQFRINDNICIAAQAGSQVKAAAAGVVTQVTQSRRQGNTVVIDSGNGWVTTYGQLMDGVLVKEGDVVRSGQVIGGVASPTIYGVLLGNHLSFKVTKDDAPVNPLDVLVAEAGN